MARIVALPLVLALMLAACAADEEAAPTDEPEAADEPEEEPAEEPEEPVDDEVYVLSYASHIPRGGVIEAGTEWFLEELESRSNGRIEVEAFFDGALLDGAELYRGLEDGIVDMAHVSQSRVADDLPLWGINGIPFVTDDPVAVQLANNHMFETDANFAAMFENAGMKPLFFKPLLAEHSLFREPVDSLDGFSGLRMRGLGGPVNEAYASLGADMVDVATPEIFESLQRGAIDGVTQQTIDLAVGNSLHEVAPYFVDAGIGTVFPVGALMRQESYDNLPPDLQQLVDDLIAEYPAASVADIPELEDGFCDELLAAGGSVTILPDAEVAAWRDDVIEGIAASWVSDIAAVSGLSEADVQAFHDNYMEAVERFQAESTYESGLQRCAARS